MSAHIHLDCKFVVPNDLAILLWPNISTASPIRTLSTIHTSINDLCKLIYAEKRHPFNIEYKLFEWAHSLSNTHKYPDITFRDVARSYWCWKCGLRYTTNTPSFGFICCTGTGCRANDTGLIGAIVPPPAKLVPKLKVDPYLAHAYKNDGKPLTHCGRNPRHDICVAETPDGALTSNSEYWTGFKLRPYGDSPSVGYDDQSGDDICADVLPEGIVRRKA